MGGPLPRPTVAALEELMTAGIETVNKFLVSSSGDGLMIMMPPRGKISHDDALLLAAYLVSMAFPATHPFEAVLAAVQAT